MLLGTSGGPVPIDGRFATSQVLVVDGSAYLIDCGNGVVSQLVRAGVPLSSLRALFVTHLHSDHVADYFHLIISGRSIGGSDGFGKLRVFGPPAAPSLPPLADGVTPVNPDNPRGGMNDLHLGVLEAFAYIVNSLYVRNASGPDIRELVSVEELDVPTAAAVPRDGWWPPEIEPFTIYEDDLVHVRGTLNHHPPVYPSFAIRFDTPYGAVTFSGDTTPHPNVTALAAGSALLVHEIMYAEEMVRHGMPEALVQLLLSTHTDVTQIGEIARTAGVGALALSHVVPLEISSSRPPELPDARWVDAIRPSFEGPIHVGRDLMRITLS